MRIFPHRTSAHLSSLGLPYRRCIYRLREEQKEKNHDQTYLPNQEKINPKSQYFSCKRLPSFFDINQQNASAVI